MKRYGPFMVMDDDTDVSELMVPPSRQILAWLDNVPPEEAAIAREVNARLSRQNLIQQLAEAAAAMEDTHENYQSNPISQVSTGHCVLEV